MGLKSHKQSLWTYRTHTAVIHSVCMRRYMLSRVPLFATLWILIRQAPLSTGFSTPEYSSESSIAAQKQDTTPTVAERQPRTKASPRGVGRELTGLDQSSGASLPSDPPGHLSEQNRSHLFTSSFPDSTRFPFLSGARTLLTNPPATWASTPSAAASAGNAPRLLQVPGTHPRGTLLPRSAAGGPVLQNTARLRFLLTVRRHSREQLLVLFFPALPASYVPPFYKFYFFVKIL